MRWLCSWLLLLMNPLTACTSDPPAEPERAAEALPVAPGHPVFGAFDNHRALAALAGDWVVRPGVGGSDEQRWTVEGDRVVAVDPTGKRSAGVLTSARPGELSLAVDRGGFKETSTYSFARHGDQLWIGLGAAGHLHEGRYVVRISDGYVAGDGETCRFHSLTRGFRPTLDEVGEPVPCSVRRQDGATTFVWTRAGTGGALREAAVEVIGEALVGWQLAKHRAERLGEPAALIPEE